MLTKVDVVVHGFDFIVIDDDLVVIVGGSCSVFIMHGLDLCEVHAEACCKTFIVDLARPFNVLGCTLKGNQLRHCAAKPIVQLAIIANTSRFLHQA